MILLSRRWGRTFPCFVFHGPLQKALGRIIPPSRTVMLGNRGAAHLPGWLQRPLLRSYKVRRKRILGACARAVNSLAFGDVASCATVYSANRQYTVACQPLVPMTTGKRGLDALRQRSLLFP